MSAESHPLRVRELKPRVTIGWGGLHKSHPLRLRELLLRKIAAKIKKLLTIGRGRFMINFEVRFEEE